MCCGIGVSPNGGLPNDIRASSPKKSCAPRKKQKQRQKRPLGRIANFYGIFRRQESSPDVDD
jgi:hypothetical protein